MCVCTDMCLNVYDPSVLNFKTLYTEQQILHSLLQFYIKTHILIRTAICNILVMEKDLEVRPNLQNPKALLKQS